jgi:hypothetical protein
MRRRLLLLSAAVVIVLAGGVTLQTGVFRTAPFSIP